MNGNFTQERFDHFSQNLQGADWPRAGRRERHFPLPQPLCNPRTTGNPQRTATPARMHWILGSRCKIWPCQITSKWEVSQSARMAASSLRSICTRILLRADGEDSWAMGRPRGRELTKESMPQGSSGKQDHSEQDCEPSVNAPWPHPASLAITGWTVFLRFLCWTPNPQCLEVWLHLGTGPERKEVSKIRSGHVGGPWSSLSNTLREEIRTKTQEHSWAEDNHVERQQEDSWGERPGTGPALTAHRGNSSAGTLILAF